MEEQEMNASPSRKTSRVEQVVGRWLRRSRDNSHRERTPGDGSSNNRGNHQLNFTVRLTVQIHKDLLLDSYGFEISAHHPIMIKAVAAGGPAERRLLPGDQILKLNSVLVDDLSGEQAAEIIRESKESVAVTVLRNTSGPKSSFITAEKRAKLKSNPFKVRFAEEVIVNGHAQGNSLLFLPNVLKVYLENGQTKAFKFEKKTTVKDIVLTLKEKLSIRCIEHFALALEEQYNISRLYLLHDDECIEQVVQKKESHDYRCLFRVCFVPRDPLDLLQEDPVAFEYLFLQSCSDVLHERFAMEMKCNVALRLAALHIQERIHTCGQHQKLSLKYIEKDWGIENFISSTLLRNMRVKDLKKAISFHMKQTQSLLEPRQKQLISAAQARLNYLKILGELKTYGGKTFSATLMLQDRESFVTLLVGAKYGISQIINNKLNILTTLTEFMNISQVQLNPESEKVSMVKIYLQDIKPITLLMESHSAKDLACLIAGYYKLFVDSKVTVFTWTGNSKIHRISAEEGYESRGCSDSEESSEIDSSQEILADFHIHKTGPEPFYRVEEDEEQEAPPQSLEGEDGGVETGARSLEDIEENAGDISEASDSCRTESHEDSRLNLSFSSDSIDALEEDDLVACSSSWPEFLQIHDPYLLQMLQQDNHKDGENEASATGECPAMNDTSFCCSQHSQMARSLTEQAKALHDQPSLAEQTGGNDLNYFTFDCMFRFEEDTMQYYNLCANVTPDSALDKNMFTRLGSSNPAEVLQATTEQKYTVNDERETLKTLVDVMILEPPPGFGDCSSDEEFFDAPERLTPTDIVTGPGAERDIDDVDICSTDESSNILPRTVRFNDIGISVAEREKEKKSRKRRSFLETDYTSQVSFPSETSKSKEHLCCYKKEPLTSHEHLSLTTSSLRSTEGEPAFLETKPITLRGSQTPAASKKLSSEQMEMEPDTMETKSVTESLKGMSSILAIRCQSDPERKEGSDEKAGDTSEKLFLHHMFTSTDDGQASPSEVGLESSPVGSKAPEICSTRELNYNFNGVSDTDHSDRLEDTLNQLRNNSYGMPQGFSQLQSDILELMRVLKENPESRGQHHKETCAVQFSENKHLLFAECRKLMSSCQKVIRVDQRPEDMLQMLSGSFQTLVHLASVCLWFTNCIRCRKRHNEVLSSLREIVSTYKEFTMAAEKASPLCGALATALPAAIQDWQRPQAKQCRQRLQAKQSRLRPQAKQSRQRPQAKQSRQRPQAKQSRQRPQAKQSRQRPQAKQDPQRPQAKQDPQRPQAKQDPQRPQVKQEPQQPQVKQDPQRSPGEAGQAATLGEINDTATPGKAEPSATPGEAGPSATPGEAGPSATPGEVKQQAAPGEVKQQAAPGEVKQQAAPGETWAVDVRPPPFWAVDVPTPPSWAGGRSASSLLCCGRTDSFPLSPLQQL
ncbi:hypothetical protein AOXY_G786 [Acipenser oxyrinchus oxyrinchus]|uniref:FERM and PDZ domain containing 1 n=1 Tax=Acipenser oxyrinchus oxyrinchus TaxID=40147 RepID=A0AAD8GJV7_ACIOX|nr:hypothetical protein AOXY_G786 [Acipenser oxyrinchus oxyrinchus]